MATPITWVCLALLRSPRFDGRFSEVVDSEDRFESGGSISLLIVEVMEFPESARSGVEE